MQSIEEVAYKEIKSVKPGTKAYFGESTAARITGIGDVIIIADDREKVLQAFEILLPDKPVTKDAIHSVALLKKESVEA
ncbi:MAG: hypothetical protein AB2552_05620 [Candidatus Thiodiazotropha endolucinida]